MQTLYNFSITFGEISGEVDSAQFGPASDPDEPVLLQLDDLQLEVAAEAVLVELDHARQASHLNL